MTSARPSLLWTLVAPVFRSHGGEGEWGEEEMPLVHGSIKYAKTMPWSNSSSAPTSSNQIRWLRRLSPPCIACRRVLADPCLHTPLTASWSKWGLGRLSSGSSCGSRVEVGSRLTEVTGCAGAGLRHGPK
jgi:hypothetical protein